LVSIRDLMYPPITLASFQALRATDKKRICFGSIHKNALKENAGGRAAGFFNVPFIETIGTLFPWELFRNKNQYGGYYRTVTDDGEFNEIRIWMSQNADVVFIRSLFSTAVAACEHYVSQNQRSRVGALEHGAKWNGNAAAKEELVRILTDVFERMHGERRIDAILSVPPSTAGQPSLPSFLASRLADNAGLPDFTACLSWNGPKGKIKELSVDEKWQALEKVGLTVTEEVMGKNLLLIDDMYQSGATAHFVASHLRAAGANDIHLLAVSKGRRDTDNK
jgi:predicted amidophosphoribosyltransferase